MAPVEIRRIGKGTTSVSVDIDLGSDFYYVSEIIAGFDSHEFGNIKFYLKARRTTEEKDSYFASGVSIPSPGGNHASIVAWFGKKFIDGSRYTLGIHGKGESGASTVLYIQVVYEKV